MFHNSNGVETELNEVAEYDINMAVATAINRWAICVENRGTFG